MRKRGLTGFLLSLLVAAHVSAADVPVLIVTLTGGQQAKFVLAEKPTVRFEGDMLSISTATLRTSYQRSEVRNFSFGTDAETGIASLEQDGGITVRQTDEGISIMGLTDETVQVFDMGGRLLQSAKASRSQLNIALPGQTKKTYLIKINNKQNIKLQK